MKNLICLLVFAFSFSLSGFAFEQPPEYDIGDEVVKVYVEKNSTKVLVAEVDLLEVKAEVFMENFKIELTKLYSKDGENYFVAIKTKDGNCEYVCCSNYIKIPERKPDDIIVYQEKKIINGSSGGLPRTHI